MDFSLVQDREPELPPADACPQQSAANQSLQLDLGADFSDLVDTVSLSAIYSF